MQKRSASAEERVAWVDYAKGICIILVVMMHCTLNYGDAVGARGWLHNVVEFARPFRMPDFFLISGLFLGLSINGPLLDYVDRKVVHFAYFYVLWLAIQLAIIEDGVLLSAPLDWIGMYLSGLVEPTNTLWFVHMLAIFYVVTRLLRRVPKWIVFAAAAGLQVGAQSDIINSDWNVIRHFTERYVYFFTGYAIAPLIFSYASAAAARPGAALAGLLGWALINGALVAAGLGATPGVGLFLGFFGAAAIVTFGALLAGRDWAKPLRYAGANSIVIYLTFFFPMYAMFKALRLFPIIPDVGAAAALITLVAVVSPLIFHWLIRDTPLNFLYKRPASLKLTSYVRAREPAPTLAE